MSRVEDGISRWDDRTARVVDRFSEDEARDMKSVARGMKCVRLHASREARSYLPGYSTRPQSISESLIRSSTD
jgi:hypothetical protein